VADLDRALARARDRLATIPAARKREELYAVQQAGRAYQRLVALLEGDETSPSLGTGYVPDLGQLWYQVETDGDRRLIMACLRYTDPVWAARLSGVLTGAATVEGLHPDDAGDPHVHHDFLAPVQEVTSAFVWIPVFEAYQLIRPANCGPALANRHRGTWVPGRPTVGTEDVDWACEVFGGFYAGKALASRIDAAPVLPGMSVNERSGSRKQIKVVPGYPPWVDVSWEDAVEICHRADPDCHLMKDDEYTALAVWATMHRLLEPAPGMSHRTHTAKQQGVIWATSGIGEWTASLVTDRHKLGGTPVNLDAEGNWPQAGVIASLSTDPALRRYGIPDATDNQQASFGSGRLDPPVPVEVAGVRGGSATSIAEGASGVEAPGAELRVESRLAQVERGALHVRAYPVGVPVGVTVPHERRDARHAGRRHRGAAQHAITPAAQATVPGQGRKDAVPRCHQRDPLAGVREGAELVGLVRRTHGHHARVGRRVALHVLALVAHCSHQERPLAPGVADGIRDDAHVVGPPRLRLMTEAPWSTAWMIPLATAASLPAPLSPRTFSARIPTPGA
jgi:hypothetical protein